jgi:hypothetical protein
LSAGSPQRTRDEALATLHEGQRRLDELLAGLSDDDLTRRATIGGGDWSAKDLIGHLATWEELAVEAIQAWRSEREPWADAVPGGVDEINARTVADKAGLSLNEVRAGAANSHAHLVRTIREMSDQEWAARPSFPTKQEEALGNRVGGITGGPDGPFRHAFAHIPDLEAYVATLR